MENTRVIDRLDEYMKYKGINDNQVTVNARLSVGLLNNARRGNYDIGKKTIDKILSFYQDINRVWLLTGSGEMISSETMVREDRKMPLHRMLDLLDREGISLEEFAKRVNSSAKQFNRAIKWPFDTKNLFLGNEAQINGWVDSFVKEFPKYSKEWILTGEGEMYVASSSVAANHTFPLRTDRKLEVQTVPLYDFDAAAGLVAIFNDLHAEPIDYLRIPNLPVVDGAIFVRGESMFPLLKSGDIVMYKKKELSLDSILWGEIYLLSFQSDGDSYTAVKYIQKSEAPGMVRLASFNPTFAPKDIPMESITALALVKASLTFHTME